MSPPPPPSLIFSLRPPPVTLPLALPLLPGFKLLFFALQSLLVEEVRGLLGALSLPRPSVSGVLLFAVPALEWLLPCPSGVLQWPGAAANSTAGGAGLGDDRPAPAPSKLEHDGLWCETLSVLTVHNLPCSRTVEV